MTKAKAKLLRRDASKAKDDGADKDKDVLKEDGDARPPVRWRGQLLAIVVVVAAGDEVTGRHDPARAKQTGKCKYERDEHPYTRARRRLARLAIALQRLHRHDIDPDDRMSEAKAAAGRRSGTKRT